MSIYAAPLCRGNLLNVLPHPLRTHWFFSFTKASKFWTGRASNLFCLASRKAGSCVNSPLHDPRRLGWGRSSVMLTGTRE